MRTKHILGGFLVIITFVIFAIIFTPPHAKAANVLRVGIGIDADSLNPHETVTTLIQNICELMYDTLYSQNEAGELVAKLATERSISKDGLVWTFKLRKGVNFHDGTPFTAEAVKAGLDRVRDPKIRAPLRFYTAMIDKVEVVDDYTVRILLKHPYAPLEWVFTQMVAAPFSPKAIRELGEKLSAQPVGTGPFKFGEWVKGERIVLVRNEGYYGKIPSLERIIFRIVPEHGTRTAMLRAGDLDMIVSPQPPDVAALEADPNLKVVNAPNSRIMFVGINTQKELLRDKRVRQALNYAVDKDAIVKKIMLGLAEVQEGPMPSCFFGYHKIGKYEYNPQKAKELLAAAKFPMDTKISLITPTGRYTFDKQVAEAVQAYLIDLGLRVELRTYDWPTYMAITFKPVEQNEVQLFLMGWGTTVLDPDFMLMGALHSSAWAPNGMNTVFYKNLEVDKLFEEAQVSQDPNKRKELYKKASTIIWDEAPMIFLYEPKFTVAYRKNAKGIVVLPVEKFNPVYATVE